MVGDILDMKYIPRKSPGSADSFKTLIKNISKNPQDLFMGHSLIELSIIEQQGNLLWFSEKQNIEISIFLNYVADKITVKDKNQNDL